MHEELISDINDKTGFIYQLWEFHHVDLDSYQKLRNLINRIAIEFYHSSTIPKKIIYELNRMLVAILVIQADIFSGSYKLNITNDDYLELFNDFEEIINRVIVPPEDMENNIWSEDWKPKR